MLKRRLALVHFDTAVIAGIGLGAALARPGVPSSTDDVQIAFASPSPEDGYAICDTDPIPDSSRCLVCHPSPPTIVGSEEPAYSSPSL